MNEWKTIKIIGLSWKYYIYLQGVFSNRCPKRQINNMGNDNIWNSNTQKKAAGAGKRAMLGAEKALGGSLFISRAGTQWGFNNFQCNLSSPHNWFFKASAPGSKHHQTSIHSLLLPHMLFHLAQSGVQRTPTINAGSFCLGFFVWAWGGVFCHWKLPFGKEKFCLFPCGGFVAVVFFQIDQVSNPAARNFSYYNRVDIISSLQTRQFIGTVSNSHVLNNLHPKQ